MSEKMPQKLSEDKVTGYVYKTQDLSKFKIGADNREINKQNVKKKKESILEFGLLNPIIVNKDFEIREGNHRFVALQEIAEETGKAVTMYYIVKTVNSTEMIAMNNSIVKWGDKDYVAHFAQLGKKQYQKLIDISEKFNIPVSEISATLNATMLYKGKTQSLFKKGKFSLEESEWSQFTSFLLHFEDIKHFLRHNRSTKISLYPIFSHFKYDKDTMIHKLRMEYAKTTGPIITVGTTHQVRARFLELYNFNAKSEKTKIEYIFDSKGRCKLVD